MKKILKIGHRGAMDLEPENTIRSIKKAIDLGVDAVEIDVYRTKDNKLAVLHYEKIETTTNGRGLVWEKTLAQLQKLDAGKGEKIPSLQEVIDIVKGKCILLIELKMYGIEKDVVESINKNGIKKSVIVISFFHDLIRDVKKIDPEIKTGVTFMCVPVNASRLAIEANADYILPQHQFITRTMVRDAHKHKLKILAWHTSDRKEIKNLLDLGVDGILSNRPDILKRIK